MTFGPRNIIAEEVADIPGAERIIIFGSWAARYTGHPGPPNDIDVLVIGHTNRTDVFDAADERIGAVNPERATVPC
jgi:predicted nucleotidyltransferase